jgi:hypothetical protein
VSRQICLIFDTSLAAGRVHATPKWDTIWNIWRRGAARGIMGKWKCDKEFVQSLAAGSSIDSATSDLPTSSRLIAAMEVTCETTAAPAGWPWALDKIAERFGERCRGPAVDAR